MAEAGTSEMSKADKIAEEFKEFVYIVSHDLSAPVRGMVEFSKLLKEEQSDAMNEDGKLYCSLIVENGLKMQSMLAALLEYSRVTTSGQAMSEVDANALVKECREALKEKLDASGGTLVVGALPKMRADPAQMKQLFLALFDNAIKFRKEGVALQIEVSAETGKDADTFRIRDNGIGIRSEFHKRIFGAFQRLHSENEYAGVGMGLTLAKRIAERHGGTIGIDREWNDGVCIWFTLPHTGNVQ